MSLASADQVLQTRGVQQQLGAFVVGAVFDRGGTCAFALGDGTVRLVARGEKLDWRTVAAHDGATLAIAPDARAAGFVTGGDDGRFQRIGGDGSVTELASFGMKWVEHVATYADGKSQLLACSVGKYIHLFDDEASRLKSLEHPSTVTGIAFDARGKRVAASHYNGASLWFVASKTDNPRKLFWKGSHTGIVISPDGDSVVTSMQENALHGWGLSDEQHMRMSGYPSKTRAMSFARNGKWLATSGAESIVLWPFFGGGPMGKAPTEIGGAGNVMCTQVACNPANEAVAAGFSDGLVIAADIDTARILPLAAPGRGPVSALAWSADGSQLALGSETGFAAVIDFSAR